MDKFNQNYNDDWGGSEVQPNVNYVPQDTVRASFMASDLTGTLMRFASPHAVPMSDLEIRMDLFCQFNNATPIELHTLSEKLVEDITHLRSLHVSNSFISGALILSTKHVVYRTLKKCSVIPMQ